MSRIKSNLLRFSVSASIEDVDLKNSIKNSIRELQNIEIENALKSEATYLARIVLSLKRYQGNTLKRPTKLNGSSNELRILKPSERGLFAHISIVTTSVLSVIITDFSTSVCGALY